MINPKRTKYRKPYRSHFHRCIACITVAFGDYGLQAIQIRWITSRQIEAGRRVLIRYVRRRGKLWIRVFPDNFITIQPTETRIGSGKGSPEYWITVTQPGIILFELRGISFIKARQVIQIVASKLPRKVQLVAKFFEFLRLNTL